MTQTTAKEIDLKLKDSFVDPRAGMNPGDTIPLANGPKKSLFFLYYRSDNNPHPQYTMFFGEGEFRAIIVQAKDFCDRMNWRFVHCKPAIIDFEMELKKRNGI